MVDRGNPGASGWFVAFAAAVLASGAAVLAQGAQGASQSGALVAKVKQLMTDQHLAAIAVPDPQAPDRFVAAMLFPDVQLLVVAGRYPSPDYLKYLIGQKDYRGAYIALQQGAVPESKLFFQDLGCDGLPSDKGDAVDVLYEKGATQTIFDGQWKKHGLSESAYATKLRDADTAYTQLLTVLTQALSTPAGD
jgi:hypothetical protein